MDSKEWAKELPAEVRDVLDAGARVSAPSGAKQAVWSALSTKLPAAAAGATAGGLSALAIIKPLAVGLALGAVTAVGVIEIRSKAAPAPRSSASANSARVIPSVVHSRASELLPNPVSEPVAPSSSLPLGKSAATADSPPGSLAPAVPSAALSAPPPSNGSAIAAFPDESRVALQEDRTVHESRRLNQARAALQAGDARAALAKLDAIAVEFPRGVLAQEADALRIEALLGLGERERAAELARRFLERYPHSPHATAVTRALR